MVKVHKWINCINCPEDPSADDMRFGIGCMNDLLLVLTEKMAQLLRSVDKRCAI